MTKTNQRKHQKKKKEKVGPHPMTLTTPLAAMTTKTRRTKIKEGKKDNRYKSSTSDGKTT